jgi:hypothetical protein
MWPMGIGEEAAAMGIGEEKPRLFGLVRPHHFDPTAWTTSLDYNRTIKEIGDTVDTKSLHLQFPIQSGTSEGSLNL